MAKKPTSTDTDDIHPLARKFLWLADDNVAKSFIFLPVLGLVITVMGQFIYPIEDKYQAPWDVIHASWAIIGFISYCTVVLCAEPLFRLLSRDEDYYGEGSDEGDSDA